MSGHPIDPHDPAHWERVAAEMRAERETDARAPVNTPAPSNGNGHHSTAEVAGYAAPHSAPPRDDVPSPSMRDAPAYEFQYFGDLPVFLVNSYPSAVQIFSANAGNILGGRRLGFNLMTGAPTANGVDLQDHDITALRGALPTHIQGVTGGRKFVEMSLARGDVWDAILEVAHRNEYHPVREYLRGLRWDGTKRIDSVPWEIFECDRDSIPLCSVLLRRWFLSAVARPLSPGCKVDTMLILVGIQGLLKSSFFSVLAGEWFCDTAVDLHNKDAFLTLRGAWILEFAELSSLHRSRDAEAAKAFITSRSDTYRAPYGRLNATVPRSSVIVGTTNRPQFLIDETGARRFWPIRPWRIDLEKLTAWRDQLWAEAVALYDAAVECAACAAAVHARRCHAHSWWLSPAEDAAMATVHDDHFASDAWEPAVVDFVADGAARTTGEILEGAIKKPRGQWTRSDEMRVAAIMVRDGWEHSKPHRGSRVWERTRPA